MDRREDDLPLALDGMRELSLGGPFTEPCLGALEDRGGLGRFEEFEFHAFFDPFAILLRQGSMLSPALVHWSNAIRLHDRAVESRCKVIGLALHLLGRSRELVRGSLDKTSVSKEA